MKERKKEDRRLKSHALSSSSQELFFHVIKAIRGSGGLLAALLLLPSRNPLAGGGLGLLRLVGRRLRAGGRLGRAGLAHAGNVALRRRCSRSGARARTEVRGHVTSTGSARRLGLLLLLAAALLLLALSLLTASALLHLLDTLLLLGLEVTLSSLAALLELLVALLGDLLAEAVELGHQTAETVLERNGLRVLVLSLLEGLSLAGLVDFQVVLLLGFIVGGDVLQFLATEGTLQVVNTLGGGANAVVQIVLLLLQLSQLHGTEAVGVQLAQIELADVNTLDAGLQLLQLLLQLLLADAFLLILDALLLTLALFIEQTLLLGFLELLGADALAGLLLALLALQSIGSRLLLLLNDDTARQGLLVLLGSTGLSASVSGTLGLQTGLVVRGVDVHAGDMQGLGQASELQASDFSGGVLQTLNGADFALGRSGGAAGVQSLGGRENVGVEGEDTRGVVDTDGEIALLAAVHDELLDHGGSDLEGVGELSELVNELELDGLVNLRQLLEETGKNDLLQRQDVLFHLRVGTNLLEDGGDLLADGQGVEVDLENVVELADLRAGTLQHTLVQGILEQNSTSGGLGHTQQVGETGVLVLADLVHIHQGAAGAGGADDRNGQGGQQDE
ncbi:hypothetical protein ASPCADRAFT_165987 [Aspergillus carbonarius ITEM 5010]|uniref:NAD-specific glutamate dehydrogenase n=1 Tax=Aspergillus carbonarius (strain ITEM 5010) TaxID=602072 RepID=A0A1R3RS47_ASPC5|nr:hypothetical protein ASPCADRAFT_165987 [Aspergillus carbonarius ITEM 5010]